MHAYELCLHLNNASSRESCNLNFLRLRVIYSRREARIDLCDFLLQNTTKFFYPGSIRRNDVAVSNKSKHTPLRIELGRVRVIYSRREARIHKSPSPSIDLCDFCMGMHWPQIRKTPFDMITVAKMIVWLLLHARQQGSGRNIDADPWTPLHEAYEGSEATEAHKWLHQQNPGPRMRHKAARSSARV